MEIVEKKIEELKPYKNNPRKNKDAVDKVAKSIQEFGFKVPVIVDGKNEIVAGHTRIEAAKKLGIKTIPTIIADDLTDDQIKAFRLVDNKTSEFSTWDFPVLDLELESIELDMEDFGFMRTTIDWDSIEEIDASNYEKPESDKLRCPICGGVDEKLRFVTVNKKEE